MNEEVVHQRHLALLAVKAAGNVTVVRRPEHDVERQAHVDHPGEIPGRAAAQVIELVRREAGLDQRLECTVVDALDQIGEDREAQHRIRDGVHRHTSPGGRSASSPSHSLW